ncbi:MAG: hypothetical protein M3179_06750 [Actinomycetota bacterium]|nr:hypothetical protein [Actinomycetota bacterium]
MIRSKKGALALFTLVAVPLMLASAAFACQRLVDAHLRPKSGPSGTEVSITGGNYIANRQVEVRWNSRTAPPLVVATTDASGRFHATFRVPNAPAGYHTVIVTQTAPSGVPCSGCPGRASFNVTGGTASGATSVDPSVLVTPIGLAGLLLLVAVSRRPRRSAEAR